MVHNQNFVSGAVCVSKVRWDSCTAAQGRRSLVRNEVTQNSPDIQASGLFAPQDAQYRVYPV